MDSHCIIIGTLLVLIIIYLLRERQNLEAKMKNEYNDLYDEWKKGTLQEELSRQPPSMTLIALDSSTDHQKIIDAIKAGEFQIKEAK
jgi:predicted Holliday junction resolvase-like endonuclease